MREWERPYSGSGANVDPPTRSLPFIFQGMCLVILTDQLFGKDIPVIFPGVVSLGISLPFDQVLKSSPSPKPAVISDGLDFVFLFSVDDVWGWSWEVGSVLFHFSIWREKTGVENIVYCP